MTDELIKTEVMNGVDVHTFKVHEEVPKEVVFTDAGLSARKTKLEARIASATAQLEKDQAELAKINNLIELVQ